MLLEKFPNINVLYIKDQASDELWSKELDEKIGDLVGPNQTALLYGSRDSFIKYYTGKYATQELVQEVFVSGREVRKAISKTVKSSADFRAGVIWASGNQYPQCYATVDIAIFNEDNSKVLLGRKPKEDKFRFIGGFSTPTSNSYEDDAIREVEEETHLVINYPAYIGSYLIDDWRYRSETNKIKTLFFVATHTSGIPQAGDDIAELKWFDIKKLKKVDIVEAHSVLLEALQEYLSIDITKGNI
jgi:bifunctional NMN adenylyltransferase/nudix hydrolase